MGTYGAIISRSQIWSVGVPPSGPQVFGLISGVYISLEVDHKNLDTQGFSRGLQGVFITSYDPWKVSVSSLELCTI